MAVEAALETPVALLLLRGAALRGAAPEVDLQGMKVPWLVGWLVGWLVDLLVGWEGLNNNPGGGGCCCWGRLGGERVKELFFCGV